MRDKKTINDIILPAPYSPKEIESVRNSSGRTPRGLYRVLWGNPWRDDKKRNYYEKFSTALRFDFLWLKNNPFEIAARTPFFVFGTDNERRLSDMGFKCILIDRRHTIYPHSHTYLHKIMAWDMATSIYDQSVCLDIDCQMVSELPHDFWEMHDQKEDVQVPLYYSTKGESYSPWRDGDGKLYKPCACYVFLRGNAIAKKILATMEKVKSGLTVDFTEEVVLAKVTDDIVGGWKGAEEYAKRFEPCAFSTGQVKGMNGPAVPIFSHLIKLNMVRRKLKEMGVDYSKAVIGEKS